MLGRFDIVSGTKRAGTETFKGYDRNDFTEAFARYLLANELVTTSRPA